MSQNQDVRAPAVAGRFYPADPVELNRLIDELEADSVAAAPSDPPARGVLLPHAGYIYSGRTALRTLASTRLPERIILLCPNHTGRGEPFAIQTSGAWETPFGPVAIDQELGARLLAASDLLREDTRAHQYEHAIEVELPLLQHFRSDFRFVPICVGSLDAPRLLQLGREMASVLREYDPSPMVVVSSDMTHYESAEAAERKDRRAIAILERVDGPELHRVVTGESISMCGIAPATVALVCLHELGVSRGHLVDYSNSGERSGDYQHVVGYAGMRFDG